MQIILGIKRTEFDGMDPGYLRLLAANEMGRKLVRMAKNEELNMLPILTNINREARNLPIFAKNQIAA